MTHTNSAAASGTRSRWLSAEPRPKCNPMSLGRAARAWRYCVTAPAQSPRATSVSASSCGSAGATDGTEAAGRVTAGGGPLQAVARAATARTVHERRTTLHLPPAVDPHEPAAQAVLDQRDGLGAVVHLRVASHIALEAVHVGVIDLVDDDGTIDLLATAAVVADADVVAGDSS